MCILYLRGRRLTTFLSKVDGAMGGVAPGVKECGELGEELQLVSHGSRIRILGYSLTSSIVRGFVVMLKRYYVTTQN